MGANWNLFGLELNSVLGWHSSMCLIKSDFEFMVTPQALHSNLILSLALKVIFNMEKVAQEEALATGPAVSFELTFGGSEEQSVTGSFELSESRLWFERENPGMKFSSTSCLTENPGMQKEKNPDFRSYISDSSCSPS